MTRKAKLQQIFVANQRKSSAGGLKERAACPLRMDWEAKGWEEEPRRVHTQRAPGTVIGHWLIHCLDRRSSVDIGTDSFTNECVWGQKYRSDWAHDGCCSFEIWGGNLNIFLGKGRVGTSSRSSPLFARHIPGRCGRWGTQPARVLWRLSFFDLIQPSSSSRRKAKCQSSWSKEWPEGSERLWNLAGWPQVSFSNLLDTGRDGGNDQHQGEANHGPVLSNRRGFIFNILLPYTDLPRSLWLQRRRWGIQRWVESVAGEKPRRRGTQCSWEHGF